MVRFALVAAILLVSSVTAAQPKPGPQPVLGATELANIAPSSGFVDDAIGGDDAHLAYAIADAANKCELHVLALDSKQDVVVDLAPAMLHAIAIPYFHGNSAFVVGQTDDGNQVGALVDLGAGAKKPIVYKLGPAMHVDAIAGDGGRWQVVLHRTSPIAGGTRHQVEVYDLANGHRIATGKALDLDATGNEKTLEFRVNHWSAGMTRAIGTKGGEWDRKENQRSPDTEATYDLIANRFVDRRPIENLMDQRKRFQLLADAGGRGDFVHMTWDNTAIQVWRDGRPSAIELDQAIANYDPKSLQGVVGRDHALWIALTVDPVNPDAVARKKADVQYLDVFHTTSAGKVPRRARVLAAGAPRRFGVLGERFWVLERSPTFDRGGRTIAVFQLQQ
ncbi:MAG TPA: hypothetical protein VMJ10_05825 [Kofleriaceae bacterium]|nr:hypothetical protein [Kofleriaceae bacterium]